MNPKPTTTPKDFFLNLGWLITLYGSVISLINLLFETINRSFPDVLNYQSYTLGTYDTSLRLSIACLIVFFPVYIIVTRYMRKIAKTDPTKRETWSRKWFVYLTVFLTSITILVDLIVLINTFLNGEITTRFIMKVITVLIITGITFGYYIFDLKKESVNNKIGNMFAILSTVIIIASLVYAFAIIGSPAHERLKRIDQQKIYDLQNIQYQILSYWQKQSQVPKSLTELNDPIYSYTIPHDPDFLSSKQNSDYIYKVIDANTFYLCTSFNTDSLEIEVAKFKPHNSEKIEDDSWLYHNGYQCFKRVLDKTKYPPVK